MTNIVTITRALVSKYGINLTSNERQDAHGKFIDFQPTDLALPEGFTVRVRIGWRSIESEFIPGSFAAKLIQTMGRAGSDKKALFRDFIMSTKESGDQIIMKINDLPFDPLISTDWPEDWSSLYLVIRKSPIVMDESDTSVAEEIVLSYGGRLLAIILSLLPVEEVELQEVPGGLPEGAKARVEVNRYERSYLNRAACTEALGTKCTVCGFDFGEHYGEIGRGYIHVHHIVPVSQIGEDYIIDPKKDLVPVCPNCHAMLHQKDPPYSVEELKRLIHKQ